LENYPFAKDKGLTGQAGEAFHFNAKKINYSKIIIAAPGRPHAHRPASL
jgi:hypothetical protein